MNERTHDTLPQSAGISALVRRIVFKLDAELRFHGHAPISDAERAGLYLLADASAFLDRIAILPGMAQHENRARRDLLELYDVFDQTMPTTGHTEPQETCAVCAVSSAATRYGQRIGELEAQADAVAAAHDAKVADDEQRLEEQLNAEELEREERDDPAICHVFEDDLRGLER